MGRSSNPVSTRFRQWSCARRSARPKLRTRYLAASVVVAPDWSSHLIPVSAPRHATSSPASTPATGWAPPVGRPCTRPPPRHHTSGTGQHPRAPRCPPAARDDSTHSSPLHQLLEARRLAEGAVPRPSFGAPRFNHTGEVAEIDLGPLGCQQPLRCGWLYRSTTPLDGPLLSSRTLRLYPIRR